MNMPWTFFKMGKNISQEKWMSQNSHSEKGNTKWELAERPRNISEKISDILHSEFQNPLVPFNKSTLESLRISEIIRLYSFLTLGIIEFREWFHRPDCPISESLKRYDYKKAMVDYIHCFNFKLHWNPCEYSSAFLEAFANYCEIASRKNNN